eukprot:2452184-Ditylum_brightwellii.AAC.1
MSFKSLPVSGGAIKSSYSKLLSYRLLCEVATRKSSVDIARSALCLLKDQLRIALSYVLTTIPSSLKQIALRRRYQFLPASLEPCMDLKA